MISRSVTVEKGCILIFHSLIRGCFLYIQDAGDSIIQSTNLFNIKQVEMKEELGFKVAFHDNGMMLLAFQNSPREIVVEDVLRIPNTSTSKEIGDM